MIILMCGLMGSGKSYEAVNSQIIPALESGRKVITNIPINIEHTVAVLGEYVRPLIKVLEPEIDEDGDVINIPFSSMDDLKDDWWSDELETGALFVIDEAQIPMPAHVTPFNKAALEYATLLRKRGHCWVLVTQDPALVYQPLIKLVTVTHKFQKRTNIGDMNSYRHFVLDGPNVSKDFLIKKEVKKYDKNKFAYYQSYSRNGPVKEQNITGAFFNLKRVLWLFGLFVACVISSVVYFFTSHIYSNYPELDLVETSENISNTVPMSSSLQSQPLNHPVALDDEVVVKVVKPLPKVKSVRKNEDDMKRSTEEVVIDNVNRKVVVRDQIYSIDQYQIAPYVNFKFHIIGNISLKDKDSDVFYGVWSSQGVQEQISRKELVKLGYSVTILNKCTHLFDHKYIRNPFYVTCHAPMFEDNKDKKKDEKKDPNNSMTVEAAHKITNEIKVGS